MEGNWKAILELKVAPRIKIFMRHATRDCLPSKYKLMSRGIQVEMSCIIYGVGVKNIWRVFAGCPFAGLLEGNQFREYARVG